ncbi:MAG TPA: glycosyltransferase family 39 protein [Rubricoccaceae bacterium]
MIPASLRRPDAHVLSLAWLAALALAGIGGDFPINDDWSYARTVQRLVETGVYAPGGWTSMPLLTNVWWGALFCLPAGFSHEALRLSTVVAGVAMGYGSYVLARDMGWTRGPAAVAMAVVLFNPLTVVSSATFMTDVPSAAAVVWAAVFFARALRYPTVSAVLWATGFSIVATLSRQTGLALPLAFGLVFVVRHGVRLGTVGQAAGPLAASVAALVGYGHWLEVTGRVPALYALKTEMLAERLADPVELASVVAMNGYGIVLTLGLVLAPLAVLATADTVRRRGWAVAVAVCALGAGVAAVAVRGLPVLGNVLVPQGAGPLTLFDREVLHLRNIATLPRAFWTAATVIGGAAAVGLLAAAGAGIVRAVRRTQPELASVLAVGAFLLLAGAATLAPLLPGDFFDRYLVPVIPLWGAGALSLLGRRAVPRRALALAAVLLVGMAAVSVVVLHDYFAWNRARWALLAHVETEAPDVWRRIDGGFEFNGWTRYDPQAARQRGRSWWAPSARDVIAFGSVRGYREVAGVPYTRWWPHGRGRIVWLQRVTPAPRSTG